MLLNGSMGASRSSDLDDKKTPFADAEHTTSAIEWVNKQPLHRVSKTFWRTSSTSARLPDQTGGQKKLVNAKLPNTPASQLPEPAL